MACAKLCCDPFIQNSDHSNKNFIECEIVRQKACVRCFPVHYYGLVRGPPADNVANLRCFIDIGHSEWKLNH